MLKSAFPMDIDQAINTALQGITLPDASGSPISVPVQYIFPEAEIVVEDYPSIIFYMMGFEPDTERITNDIIRTNEVYNAQGDLTQADYFDDADPFIVNYDIRCYTTYEEDSKNLQKQIMTLFPFRGTLNINGVPFDMDLRTYVDLTKGRGHLNSSSLKLLEVAPQRQQVVSLQYKVYTAFNVHKATTQLVASSGVNSTVNPQ